MLLETQCPVLPPKKRDYDYGGTDVACILGVNKYKSRYNYWLEKKGMIPVEDVQGDAVYWGVQAENMIVGEFLRRFAETDIFKSVELSEEKEVEIEGIKLGGECDGIIRNSKYFKKDIIVEAKTANSYSWKENFQSGKEIPINYDCQGAYYCAKTGIRTVIFCVLTDGKYYFLERNYTDQECQYVIDSIKDFHKNYIDGDKEPEVDGSSACTEFLKEHSNKEAQGEFCPDEENDILSDVESMHNLNSQIKELEKERDKHKNKIVKAMNDYESYSGQGFKVTFKWASDSTSFDAKELEKDNPDLYIDLMGKYSKTRNGGRRLLIKEV